MHLIFWFAEQFDSRASERVEVRSLDFVDFDGPIIGSGRVVSLSVGKGIRRNRAGQCPAPSFAQKSLTWLGEVYLDVLAGSGLGLIAGSSLGFCVCGISMALYDSLDQALAVLVALTVIGTVCGGIFGLIGGTAR